ncbi:hypothetical protein FQN60_004508, partial [Etheostoma spectabile]
MSGLEEEGDGAESGVSSCLSMKTRSRGPPPDLSDEPGPSDTKLTSDQKMSDLEEEEDGAESGGSGCWSMKTWSKEQPPDLSDEPGPSDTKERKRSDDSEEEQPSRSRSRTRAGLQTANQSSSTQ